MLRDDDLNETDRRALDLLAEGRVTPPYVAERLDKSREYASERLIRLREHGHVRRVAPGLYELVDDPRADAGTGTLPEAVADLEAAFERGDWGELEAAIGRLKDVTGVDDE